MELSDPDGILYQALLKKDPRYNGLVFYGITSTGIFCRSICRARKPLEKNVRYFPNQREALNAGFRPCKICGPMELAGAMPPLYEALVSELQDNPSERFRDQDLRARGIEPETLRRWFKKQYGMTFQAFSRSIRLTHAFGAIACGRSVLDAALDAGYEGPSGFGSAVRTHSGLSPSQLQGKNMFFVNRFETPLGTMVSGDFQGKLCLLEFADRRALPTEIMDLEKALSAKAQPGRTAFHNQVETQVKEYFAHSRREFELPLHFPGTEFQQQVWQGLLSIPYGQTRSYADQALLLGKPRAVRAVASCNGKNRISIVIPCHRVIGSNGSLTGYGGGLDRKRFLLDLEQGLGF